MYRIEFTSTAAKDVLKLQKSEHRAYVKLENLLQELQEHPTTGTGKPEPLKGNRSGQWSRSISQKHRLVYEIKEEIITVLVLVWGTYPNVHKGSPRERGNRQ